MRFPIFDGYAGPAARLLVAAAVLVACEPREYGETETRAAEEVPALVPAQDSPAMPGLDTMADAVAVERTIPFQPAPGSEVSGTVRLTETSSRGLILGAELTGLGEGDHAWHIYGAPCGVDGPVVVPITRSADQAQGLGEALRADSEGRAAALVTIPAEQVPAALRDSATVQQADDAQSHVDPISLRVYEGSGEQAGPVVACADLTVAAPPTTR